MCLERLDDSENEAVQPGCGQVKGREPEWVPASGEGGLISIGTEIERTPREGEKAGRTLVDRERRSERESLAAARFVADEGPFLRVHAHVLHE